MADHWLAEMLADCLCYAREKDFIENLKIDLSVPTEGEVERASTRILRDFERQLGPGYVYFAPLPDSKLCSVSDYYKLIVLGSMDVYRAILRAYDSDGFEDYIRSSPRMSRLDELLEDSIEAVVGMLGNPESPWEPRRWLPGGSNSFQYSVYEYERIWRPGRYKFGRKEGLLGAVYYNSQTDRMISWASRYAESHDLWWVIRLGIAALYKRGKGQWPIAGAFIRTLISRKPSNVRDTMAQVARQCGLKKYQEIIPD
jgi:hypothetical protein